MADLTLMLAFPQSDVVSGENFSAKITITNTGRTATVAPADFGDADYRFAFAPAGGGNPIVLSRQAFKNARRPGNPTERPTPRSSPITEELAAGATRVAEVYPARLATRPIPTGIYEVTVSLFSAPAIVSRPVRLKVEAPNIVRHHITSGGPMSGSELTYLHRDQSGVFQLFGGEGEAAAPTRLAGLRLAQVTGPIEGLQLAHAVHSEDRSGPLMTAWLTGDGMFFAVVARSAYVVAKAGPLELGLREAQLAPMGWKTGEQNFAASFAVVGKAGNRIELALISLDRDGKWAPKVRRIPLALPEVPKTWRLSQRGDGGQILFAAYPKDTGTRILKLQIGGDGAAQGDPIELLSTAHPLVALSAPLIASAGALLQVLSGPDMAGRANPAKDDAAMVFHAIPIEGAAPRERRFPVPVGNGSPPSNWSLAEGAPLLAAIVGRSGKTLLGVRIGDEITSVPLIEAKPGSLDLTALVIGPNAWAVWREGTASVESHPFRR